MTKQALLFSALLFLVLACRSRAAAEIPSDCLMNAKDKVIAWNSSWQGDQADDGIQYRIIAARFAQEYRGGRPVLASATFELVAQRKADKPFRYLVISEEKVAQEFCLHIERGSTPPVAEEAGPQADSVDADPGISSPESAPVQTNEPVAVTRAPERPAPDKTEDKTSGLPFIKHGASGWVRANAPKEGNLSICEAFGRAFSCLSEEKRSFQNELRRIEEQAKSLP